MFKKPDSSYSFLWSLLFPIQSLELLQTIKPELIFLATFPLAWQSVSQSVLVCASERTGDVLFAAFELRFSCHLLGHNAGRTHHSGAGGQHLREFVHRSQHHPRIMESSEPWSFHKCPVRRCCRNVVVEFFNYLWCTRNKQIGHLWFRWLKYMCGSSF